MADFPLLLAIDTSCDETAAAVTRGRLILSNVIASQAQLHQQYGGVFPTVAKTAHQEKLPRVVSAALQRAGVTWSAIDQIAVTRGPGLAPTLEMGINYAQALANQHHKPLVAVNHLEGHVLSVLAAPNTQATNQLPSVQFPALGVLISGGHSEFIVVTALGKYQRLGWTVDDAAGECLDKIGRMLDLGYPAGPVLEELAKTGDAAKYPFPLPMTTSGDYNVSFSGLKTFARNLIIKLNQERQLTSQDIADLAAATQAGVIRALTYKLGKILAAYPEIREVWISGGVAANRSLRQAVRKLAQDSRQEDLPAIRVRVPYTDRLCGDNAAMIGVAAGRVPRPAALSTLDRLPNWKLAQAD